MADAATAADARPRLHRGNVAVVIPALNEALRIRDVVLDARAHCDQVIVVDDGSDDDTVDRIADLGVTVLRHPHRMGKGAALRSGFAQARDVGAAVLAVAVHRRHGLRADAPRLVAAANRHPGCVIVGARLRKRAAQPVYRRIGNDFGDWGIGWGCGFRVVDSQSGQRLYPRAVYTLDDVPGEGFVFEAQMLISAARRAGAGVVAVPIETRYAGAGAPELMRKSHFRLFHDLRRITTHVVAQVWKHGDVVAEYRRCRARHPVIHDPDGEFAALPSANTGAERTG